MWNLTEFRKVHYGAESAHPGLNRVKWQSPVVFVCFGSFESKIPQPSYKAMGPGQGTAFLQGKRRRQGITNSWRGFVGKTEAG